jgi:serine/threonine protein phosphatase PrpC
MHTANDIFLKVAERQRLHDGSTGICALIRDGKLLVGNVGDCRTLLLSGGRSIQMSTDQKPTSPDEQKRIIGLGGAVLYCMGVARVNGVLAVSRAFGNRTLRTVIRPDAEMMQRELTKDDDYIVIASDGMWDVLRNKDVAEICYALQGQPPQFIAEELVQTALLRGSMDNVTCLVVNINGYINRVKGSKTSSSSSHNNNGVQLSSTLNGSGIRPSSSHQVTGPLFNNNSIRQQEGNSFDNLSDFNNDMNNSIISRANEGNNNNSKLMVRSQHLRQNAQRPVTVQSQQNSYMNSNIDDDDDLTYVSQSQNVEPSSQPLISRQSASSRLAAAFGFQQQQQRQQQQLQKQQQQRSNQLQAPSQLQVGLFNNSGSGVTIPSSPIQKSWKQMRPSTTGTVTGRSLIKGGQQHSEFGICNRPSPVAMLLERTTGSSMLNSSINGANNSNSSNGNSMLKRFVQRGGSGDK